MKTFFTFALTLLISLSLAGCSQTADSVTQAADASPDKWGITLETGDVTPNGLTLICSQSGGEDVHELNTGSFYSIQKLEDSAWADVAPLPHEQEIAWTTEAWIIQKGGTTEWDIHWSWLYGELPAGEYRLVKPISNFKGPGDYATEPFYATFTIE